MSEAGRRRSAHTRPAAPRGARTTAVLTVLTLGAAVVVPLAIAVGDGPPAQREARRQAAGSAPGAAAGTLAGAPTDQIRSREWHLETLHVKRAWKYSKGRGVTVAVLDTGVDKNHPDLTGQVIAGPDLTGGVRRPGTRYWGLHGTSMASIIAGHGHGPGQAQGMMGIAPQSNILSIRVTLENDDPLRRDNGQQSGGGDRDAVAQGIRYAVDHGAEIINMSLGGGRQFYNGTKSQENAIKYALGKGVVLIASAGNDGSGANRKNFPAAYPGVIAVGALDRRLRLWKDSNRRSHAAVCAPGVDIVSADASNGYVVGTGTSASSAMVAGVAALVRSRYPKLTPDEVRRSLIQGSPARRGHPTGSSACRGPVDALRTLYAAHEINKTSSGPVQTPAASPTPEPVAQDFEAGSGLLLPLVLGGGGLLVVLGLVLGWRQRDRPEDDIDETDAVPDYGLPAAPPTPRRPVTAAAAPHAPHAPAAALSGDPASDGFVSDGFVSDGSASGGAPVGDAVTGAAPVNAPLWQSTDAYQGPSVPPLDGSPLDTAPLDGASMDDSSWEVSWDGEAASDPGEPPASDPDPPPAPEQPLVMSHELRPFIPGEYSANGGNGHGTANGHGRINGQGHGNGLGHANGHEPPNGHDFGGAHHTDGLNGASSPPPSAVEWPTGALPPVPPPPDADPEGPIGHEPPRDRPDWRDQLDRQDDEPRGRHSRRANPSDDEDYRPPWW